MKKTSHLLPTPSDLTIDQVWVRFSNDEVAREYLEAIRWPNGATCPHCKSQKVWKLAANGACKIRHGLYECSHCDKQFTVTVGTIFEDSHIPLRKWMVAWWLLCSSKKGISSLQIQRMLGLGSYRTALFMMHRIRHALRDPVFNEKLTGIVEADETYVGGKPRHNTGDHTRGRGTSKTPVFAVVQRNGNVRSQVVARVTGETLKKAIRDNVDPSAKVITDEFTGYKNLYWLYQHDTVNHSAREYARGNVHTNTIESVFALLKRGVYGTFHSVSKKHLPLYLAEFDHRWNYRKTSDGVRTVAGIQKAEGKRLMYKQPKG
jgi:transposase-like protein